MSEFPVFVPYGSERIACVLTIPDEEPHGLWVLLPGQGAPRSTQYHFPLWTRVARGLADRAVASVRIDQLGVGDSTGHLPVLEPGPTRADQVLAVARFAMRATGVTTLGLAGNCYGGNLALETAIQAPECVGVVAAHTAPPVDTSALTRSRKLRHRIRTWEPVARLFRTPFGRSVLDPVSTAVFGRSRGIHGRDRELDRRLRGLLERAKVLYVSGDDEVRYHERLRPFLDRFVPTLPPGLAGRIASEVIPGTELGGYMSLPAQRIVEGLIVAWATESTSDAVRSLRPEVRGSTGSASGG